MKNKILYLIFIGILCVTLTGCTDTSKKNSGHSDKASDYVLRNDLVSISVLDTSLTKSKVTVVLTNHTDETYIYGEPYSIEYAKDNLWYEMTPINEMVFNEIAYILETKQSREMTIDWEYHYGKLISGKYRIIKDVFPNLDRANEPGDHVYIGAEFVIK